MSRTLQDLYTQSQTSQKAADDAGQVLTDLMNRVPDLKKAKDDADAAAADAAAALNAGLAKVPPDQEAQFDDGTLGLVIGSQVHTYKPVPASSMVVDDAPAPPPAPAPEPAPTPAPAPDQNPPVSAGAPGQGTMPPGENATPQVPPGGVSTNPWGNP